jgi:hypothetical protein
MGGERPARRNRPDLAKHHEQLARAIEIENSGGRLSARV